MSRFVALADHTRFGAGKMEKCNLFESERMFCDLYCLEPGQAQKPHAHAASDKVYVVMSGEVRVSVGGEERVLGPGGAAWAAPGEAHALHNASSARATVLVFMTPKP
ncbi:MAG TPA: cupin domain-containing protein [Myxococcota bacterium]|jgi:quercetin dioxygenase-like cupin family protein|nr:cupin domain-containing protein [Myxococcota bacterium]